MQNAEEILKVALNLPLEQRAELAHRLLRTLEDDPVDPDWVEALSEELARRADKLHRGETQLVPWPEALARIQTQLQMKNSPPESQK